MIKKLTKCPFIFIERNFPKNLSKILLHPVTCLCSLYWVNSPNINKEFNICNQFVNFIFIRTYVAEEHNKTLAQIFPVLDVVPRHGENIQNDKLI
jgi:hypothetical protein